MDCLDDFSIVRTFFQLYGQFLEYMESLWIVREVFFVFQTVSGLSGQFLDYSDSF